MRLQMLTSADTSFAATFNSFPPEATEMFRAPNSCNSCHTDKTVERARDTLRT